MSAATKIALIQVGYQHYAVPIEELSAALAQFERFRKVGQRYDSGYVYWYEDAGDADEIGVTIVAADRIHPCEPAKAPAKVSAIKPKAPDERLIAAPSSEPISIGSVPVDLREFVNEHRDDENAA